jgi:hypothetical protein
LCAASLLPLRGRRFGVPQGGVDLRLDAAGGQRCQPRLRSAGFELVAETELPFPDIRFGRSEHRVFDALVIHSVFPGVGTSRQKLAGNDMFSLYLDTVDCGHLNAGE